MELSDESGCEKTQGNVNDQDKNDSDIVPIITKNNEPFKKPQLIIGPQRGRTIKGDNNIKKSIREINNLNNESYSSKEVNSDNVDVNTKKDNSQKHSDTKPPPPLNYKEPDWGGTPKQEYKLEELKSGTIVRTINLCRQSFVVFGRLENCDISMLHPTVSRYHAILQYRANGDEENEPGFYIYDLGSSLGTFLNKQKLKSKVYVRVKVGHVVKIGCSTRMFILQGPPDDEEPESDLTVTELKQQYRERLLAMEAEKARLEAEEEERLKREEEKGVDWGMGEDADEETDLTENPYASTQNEELYLEDPKKTLRGWFEREGEELEYDVEEKGFGHFVCRIELPIDNGGGGSVVAEASVKGKKKEAVVQAALEACRLLDRQGLLRQSTHESKKKAAKDWESVDYYDSDEDNFLDRTGQIEKKREQRMAQAGKLETVVETYETLMEKYQAVVRELESREQKLDEMLSLATKARTSAATEDDLDAYMNSLRQAPADKLELKKLKNEVLKLRAEEGRIRNLVNLTRPTELPKLQPVPTVKPVKEKKMEFPLGIIGKKSAKKRSHQETVLPLETTQQTQMNDTQEEFDEDEEQPESNNQQSESKTEETGETILKEEVKKKKKTRTDTRIRNKKNLPTAVQVDDEDFSNCTWTPPVGQTGDGRTSLNDKLGY